MSYLFRFRSKKTHTLKTELCTICHLWIESNHDAPQWWHSTLTGEHYQVFDYLLADLVDWLIDWFFLEQAKTKKTNVLGIFSLTALPLRQNFFPKKRKTWIQGEKIHPLAGKKKSHFRKKCWHKKGDTRNFELGKFFGKREMGAIFWCDLDALAFHKNLNDMS